MRIGLFTDVYTPSINGVVVAVETLKEALERKGHEVFIITMNNKDKTYIKKDHCLMIPGFNVGIYDYSVRITYPIKAIKMVKDLNLDLIHSHTEFSMGLFAKSMAKKLNIPHVHTYHTMYQDSLDYVTKGYFPKISKDILKAYMKKFFHNSVNEIIVPTNKTKKFLQKDYKLKQNINVIPNSIDIEKFYKENIDQKEVSKIKKSLKIKDSDFIILWMGRLGYEKRIDYLIERQKDLILINKNCKLVIVGGGPEEENLRNLVKENDLENNVIFTGKVKHDLVKNYYQIASVVATASFYETQGLTVVEALASSKPAICSSDEVFLEVVKNDYNGYCFKSKKDYIEKITILMNDRKKLEKMSEAARKSVSNYEIEFFATKILKVYKNALKK